jgi:hypothetical protein
MARKTDRLAADLRDAFAKLIRGFRSTRPREIDDNRGRDEKIASTRKAR